MELNQYAKDNLHIRHMINAQTYDANIKLFNEKYNYYYWFIINVYILLSNYSIYSNSLFDNFKYILL